jgi:hypothetical protein
MGIRTSKILTYDTALLFNQQANIPSSINLPSEFVIGVSAGVYSNSMSNMMFKNTKAHAKALTRCHRKHGFTVAFLPHYITV